ncbi:hypothetical protein AAG570_010153 [Ranatra chinensis]|uniref:Uncharacterized protein n=1 Tax=Ranatra chinensis TaxID=642074 RepID=A0ABD0YLQ1_9HEMI
MGGSPSGVLASPMIHKPKRIKRDENPRAAKVLLAVWRAMLVFPVVLGRKGVPEQRPTYSGALHAASLIALATLLGFSCLAISETSLGVDSLSNRTSTEVIVIVSDYFSLITSATVVVAVSCRRCPGVLRVVAALRRIDLSLGDPPAYRAIPGHTYPPVLYATALAVARSYISRYTSPAKMAIETLTLILSVAGIQYASVVLNIRHRFWRVNGILRRFLSAEPRKKIVTSTLNNEDFHLFTKPKYFLGGKRFSNDEEVKETQKWLSELERSVFDEGIKKACARAEKVHRN